MEEKKMKDSGIKWIGQIPEDWDIKKIKYCTKFINGFAFEGDDLSVDGNFPVIRIGDIKNGALSYEECLYTMDNKGLSPYKILPKDILIAMSGATTGKVGFVNNDKEAYINQRVGIIRSDISKFLFYVLSCDEFLKYIELTSYGSAQPNISSSDIGEYPFALPPTKEILKIVNILDEKCAYIDEIISKTEKQIEILEQYKKSLITETVTKGLKNSKLINSDIKWIGEIPFDWNTKKIKYVATLKGRIGWQGLTSDEYQDEGPYLITGVDFLDGQINWENCVHILEKRWAEAVDIRIKENDLLITKDGTVGKVALVKNLKDKASLNSGVLLINLEEEYDKKYLFWVLQSDIFWKWFSYTNSGNSTIIHLYQHDFDNFEYPIPPMKEQKEIAAFLNMKCEKTDKIIKKQKESLEILKKYKQSLIYEYVTGKKRV